MCAAGTSGYSQNVNRNLSGDPRLRGDDEVKSQKLRSKVAGDKSENERL